MTPRDTLNSPTLGPIEDVSRRGLLVAPLMAAVFVACRGDSGDDTSDGQEPGATGFPRTVTHTMGSATIPAQPQRIAAVSDGVSLDHLLALGITPVLYGQTPGYDGKGELQLWAREAATGSLTSYQADRLEPDMERFAASAPDLIVASWINEDQYRRLAAIAPTIVIKVSDATAWPEMQRMVGEATGLEQAAEAALAETDAAIEAAAARLAPYAGRSVTVGYQFQGELYMHGPDTPIARLLVRMGLSVRGADGSPDNELTTFSLEQVNRYQDADILLSPSFFPEDQDALESSPLFRTLPAVRQGRYMPLPRDIAQAGYEESTLSVRWVVSRLAGATIEAAEGRGKRFS
jgi:iron complex transport system substrate-binding protein